MSEFSLVNFIFCLLPLLVPGAKNYWMTRLCRIAVVALVGFHLLARSAAAVPIDDLDPSRQWKVGRIEISGNLAFPREDPEARSCNNTQDDT